MDVLIRRLSSYNILNCLLPGSLFAVAVDPITSYDLVQDDIVVGLFVYYFIGLVISRIGSLIVEPVLKTVKFITFADYGHFVKASQDDPKIDVLSETNNMYRTLCAFLLILLAVVLSVQSEPLIVWYMEGFPPIIGISLLLAMFLFSYRKQTAFICERVNQSTKGELSSPESGGRMSEGCARSS